MINQQTSTVSALWEQIAPLLEPNGGFMAGCVDGRIVVAGGTNWSNDAKRWLDVVWVYDPAQRKWSVGPRLPHPLAYAAFASDDVKLFMAGGSDGHQSHSEAYSLDAELKLSQFGRLPGPSVFAGAAIRGSKMFVLGGTPDSNDWSKISAELHTISLTTGCAAPLPTPSGLSRGIGLPAMVAGDGELLAFTGAGFDHASKKVQNVSTAFAFNETGCSCRNLRSYPITARGVFGVALDDQHIYLGGGFGGDAETFLSTAFIYDVKSDRYYPSVPLPLAACTCLVKCGEYIYTLGGEDRMKHRADACFRIRASALIPGNS